MDSRRGDQSRLPLSVEGVLAQRRAIRARPGPDHGIAGTLNTLKRQIDRSTRAEGRAEAAWASILPTDLADASRVLGLSRGVLTVRARDASVRYRIDRWLRSGGERRVREAARAPITRVRVTL